ncbi:hypothetical protein OJAV_G00023000 [Oryzias javanicus]|uniref:Uncharacterized protein n=1 Tax=Oryzias javanicus TaxID=123683 RepID=A0A3S2PZU5_ORYJA|nr:hypothetical protein OJAV_G00023000 [Oryzias javanicus]
MTYTDSRFRGQVPAEEITGIGHKGEKEKKDSKDCGSQQHFCFSTFGNGGILIYSSCDLGVSKPQNI